MLPRFLTSLDLGLFLCWRIINCTEFTNVEVGFPGGNWSSVSVFFTSLPLCVCNTFVETVEAYVIIFFKRLLFTHWSVFQWVKRGQRAVSDRA